MSIDTTEVATKELVIIDDLRDWLAEGNIWTPESTTDMLRRLELQSPDAIVVALGRGMGVWDIHHPSIKPAWKKAVQTDAELWMHVVARFDDISPASLVFIPSPKRLTLYFYSQSFLDSVGIVNPYWQILRSQLSITPTDWPETEEQSLLDLLSEHQLTVDRLYPDDPTVVTVVTRDGDQVERHSFDGVLATDSNTGDDVD